jgi:hypothetical protein
MSALDAGAAILRRLKRGTPRDIFAALILLLAAVEAHGWIVGIGPSKSIAN